MLPKCLNIAKYASGDHSVSLCLTLSLCLTPNFTTFLTSGPWLVAGARSLVKAGQVLTWFVVGARSFIKAGQVLTLVDVTALRLAGRQSEPAHASVGDEE